MECLLVAAQAETRFGSDLDGLIRACRSATLDFVEVASCEAYLQKWCMSVLLPMLNC